GSPRKHPESPWLYKTCMFSTYFSEQERQQKERRDQDLLKTKLELEKQESLVLLERYFFLVDDMVEGIQASPNGIKGLTICELKEKWPGQPDGIVDLLYNEYLLREKAGETPRLEDYLARFPQLAGPLRDQFEVQGALQSEQAGHAAVGGRKPHPPLA